MRRLLTIFAALAIAHSLWADDVTMEQAREIATQFLNSKVPQQANGRRAKSINGVQPLNTAYIARKNADAPADLFVFNKDDGKGFVIVAGTDAMPNKILGYSDENSLVIDEHTPEVVHLLLKGFQSRIQRLRERNMSFASETDSTITYKLEPVVGPLLRVNYNQGEPFNAYTPVVDDWHCPTGCGPTAAAQIMEYWRWPESGVGEHTSQWETAQYAHFSESDYRDWSNSGVARLMADLGTAADSEYKLGETGTNVDVLCGAMCKYFKYTYRKLNGTEEDLKETLDKGHPVFYTGHGSNSDPNRRAHFFVCDGYDSGDYFHFNFGWGGQYNGYYSTVCVHPGNDNFSVWEDGVEFIPDHTPIVEYEHAVYCAVGDDEAELLACSDGKEVVVPSEVTIDGKVRKVTSINEVAFQNAPVESLVLPGTLKSIKREWFYYSGQIKNITLGEGTTEIDPMCFMSKRSLETISLPSTLEKIGNEAFYFLRNLTTVNGLENSKVTELSDSCFCFCPSLKKINTSKIKKFGDMSFFSCEELMNVILQDGVVIGDNAFLGCCKLPYNINIENASMIGSHAFSNCNLNKSELVLTQAKSIGSGAFGGNNTINKVTLPACTEFVGAKAFDCKSLESIEVAEDNPCYASLDGALFSKDMKTLCFVPCNNQQPVNQDNGTSTYNVPEGVTHILDGALATKSVIRIPETVTMIDSTAFHEPRAIYCYSQNAPIYTYSREKHDLLTYHTEIHMPYGRIDYYRNAQGWKESYKFVDDVHGIYPDASKVQMLKVYYRSKEWDGVNSVWKDESMQKNIGFNRIYLYKDKASFLLIGDILHEDIDSVVISGIYDGSGYRYMQMVGYDYNDKVAAEYKGALKDISKLVIRDGSVLVQDHQGNTLRSHVIGEYSELTFAKQDEDTEIFCYKYKYLSSFSSWGGWYEEWTDAENSCPLSGRLYFYTENDSTFFYPYNDLADSKKNYLMQLTVPEPQADDYPVSGYILMSFRSGNQITLPRENFARLDINEGHANVIGYDGALQNSFDAQKLHYIEGCDYDLTSYQKIDWSKDDSPKMYLYSVNGYKEVLMEKCDTVPSDGLALLIDNDYYDVNKIDSITFERPATAEKGVFHVSDMCREIVTPDYCIDFGAAIDLGEGKTVTVEPMRSTALIGKVNLRGVKSYEISMSDGTHELGGVARIRIPLGQTEGYCPGAAWYNQDSVRWEPICSFYDEKTHEVVILTDHLSEFAVFEVMRKDTRAQGLVLLDFERFMLQDNLTSQESAKVLLDLANIDEWDTRAYRDWVADKYGKVSQFGLDIGYNAVQAAGYQNSFLEKFGDEIGYIGTAMSAYQIIRNIEQGKDYEAAAGMMKLALDQTVNLLGKVIGGAAFYATAASLGFINYALNKFGETAWNGRKDLYRAAYDLYYHSEGYRSRPKWYEMIKPLFTNKNLSEDEMKEEIDKMVTEYSKKFWEDPTVITYYLNEAKNLKFTGLGGLSQSLMDEISEEGKKWAYDFSIAPVIKSIGDDAVKMNWDESYRHITNYMKMLNQVVTLNLFDGTSTSEGSDFADCIVRFQELPETITDPESWQCRLDENGNGEIKFRAYAQIANEIEPVLEIVDPKDDRVLNAIKFKLDLGTSYIDISNGAEDFIPMDDIDNMKLNVTTSPESFDISVPMSGEYKIFSGVDETKYFLKSLNWPTCAKGKVSIGKFTDDMRECIKENIPLLGKKPSGENIEIQGKGLILSGTFDEKTKTGDGTFTLDCETFFKYATKEEAKYYFISDYEERTIGISDERYNQLLDMELDFGWLLDGTTGHKITGNFTVEQVTPYRLSYKFMGTGTFSLVGNTPEIINYAAGRSDYREADVITNPFSSNGTCEWIDTIEVKIAKEDE